jgi:hypothetical protein
VQTLWHVAERFLISGCTGIVVGIIVLGFFHFHINFLFFLALAPGLIAGLGMPPFSVLLFDVCLVNFLLYGIIGVVLYIVWSLFRSSGPPEPVIINKGNE